MSSEDKKRLSFDEIVDNSFFKCDLEIEEEKKQISIQSRFSSFKL